MTKVFKDGLNYELDTGKVRKQHCTYHIKLLSKWQSRDEIAAFVLPESPEMSLPHENHVPPLDNEETWENVLISDELAKLQKEEVRVLLNEFSDVFSGKPNLTHVATHRIDTGEALPIRSSPYKIPQKLEEEVNKEIEKMLHLPIDEPVGIPCRYCPQAR